MCNKLAWGLIISVLLGGCQSITYYSQAVSGQVAIWSKQRDVEELLANPQLDEKTRARLETALKARHFASERLQLPENDSYLQYAKLERDYVVWNVVKTPRFRVDPVKSCFPVAGCLSYRGYYSKEDALEYAREQKQAGLDVWLGGVTAYSTLGWFDDPLLSTMFSRSEIELVGLIFHELAHQRVYAWDDTRFNESFATAVEELGLRRWVLEQQPELDLEAHLEKKRKRQAIIRLILDAREQMRLVYRDNAASGEQALLQLKREQFQMLKQRYRELQESGDGLPGYDRFFSKELNNASLALFAEYHGWVAAFKKLFKQHNGHWEPFYDAVESLSRLPEPERVKQLGLLQQAGMEEDDIALTTDE